MTVDIVDQKNLADYLLKKSSPVADVSEGPLIKSENKPPPPLID